MDTKDLSTPASIDTVPPDDETSGVSVIVAPDGATSRSKKWTPMLIFKLVVLLFGQCSVLTGYSMISPFFPQVAEAKGVTQTEIGLMFASFQAATFVMTPIYGYLIVKLKPKFLCVSGLFLCGGCFTCFGFLSLMEQPYFSILCFAMRLIEGNGSAMLIVSVTSLVIDTFPQSSSIMASLVEMVIGLGYIIGPAVGAGLYAIDGFYLPFVVAGGLCFSSCLVLIFILPNEVEASKQDKSFLHLLRIPGFLVLFVHSVIACLALTFMDPVFSDWADKTFDVTPKTVGLLFSGWSAAYTIMAPVAGKISDKGFVYSTMLVGVLGCGIDYLLLGPSPLLDFILPAGKPIFPMMVVVALLLGVFAALIYVPPYQAALDLAAVNGYDAGIQTYGLIAGLLASGNSLGSCIGPLMAGYLTEHYGFAWSTTAMAFTSLSMAIILSVYLLYMKISGKPLKPSERDTKQEVADDEERRSLISPYDSAVN